jgi:aryl-alcohol dehydrogenase-like predicted oxidoreductase
VVRYVEVGGARVSAIGLGTWQFGSKEWGYGRDYAERTAVEIVHRALDLGVTLLDTAEVYAMGESERIVGRALAGRRAEAFVATKLFPVLPVPAVTERRARASAARLGVDTIDLYQLHWPNPAVPLSRQMEGLRRLQTAGLVRHVGVSNYSLTRWASAEEALGAPVLSDQVSYSLADRSPERALLPYAATAGRLVIAYSPLAQGFLTGRYGATNPPVGAWRARNPLFLPENLAAGAELLGALRDVADDHDATPAQVALAWAIRRPNVVAIPGASTVAQVEANVAAADLELTDDQDARLTAASDRFRPRGRLASAPGLIRARLRRAGGQTRSQSFQTGS